MSDLQAVGKMVNGVFVGREFRLRENEIAWGVEIQDVIRRDGLTFTVTNEPRYFAGFVFRRPGDFS